MNRHTLLIPLALALFSAPARADLILSFDAITANDVGDVAIGESQLSVTVSAVGSQVAFTFNNAGPLASSITDVYFDDGTLLAIATIVDGAGVDFEQGASPGNLPSGNDASPPFVASVGFTADSEPPAQPNGVNPGETVQIIFDLQAGKTLADVEADLLSGALRIGVHVQGFATGGSESFVNGAPVPEPATLGLVGVGLVVLGAAGTLRRRLS